MNVRKWLSKTGLVNKLLEEYRNLKDMRQKYYSINIITCHILIEEFKDKKDVLTEISQKYQQIMNAI